MIDSSDRLREVSNVFRTRKIKMLPASLNEICGCRVGIIDVKSKSGIENLSETKSCLGIEFDGSIYTLEKKDNGIARLTLSDIENIKFEVNPNWTDYIDLLIGGVHTTDDGKNIDTTKAPVEDFCYNLAFIPQNRKFCETYQKTFSDAEDLIRECENLGYGQSLSLALGKTAAFKLLNEGKKQFTLKEVQTELILHWSSARGRNVLSMRKGPIMKGERFVKIDGEYLISERELNLSK